MAYPSDLTRTKDWSTEILYDTDLEGQFDLIITWLMAFANESTGHTHTGAENNGPKITLTTGVTGALPIANGGTGAATQQAAINALAGAVTANRLLKANGTNIVLAQVDLTTDVTGVLPVANSQAIDALLPAQGSASGKFLTSNGTNASWGAAYTPPTASAGDNVVASSPSTYSTTETSYTKMVEVNVPKSGTLRISFTLSGYVGPSKYPYAQIYRNGSAVGTERSNDGSYSEDISGWSVNDLLQVYMKQANGTTAVLTDFKIKEQYPSQYAINL